MKKILIVDDAMFMRRMLSDILRNAGYEIVGEAANGMEAFKKYKEFTPDLVTMDITMPDYTGIEGLKMIRGEDPSASIVMVSAMGQENMVVESVQAGAKGFIVKPFQADKVVETVEKLIGK